MPPNTDINYYAAFVRQRRSLLVVSILLGVYHAFHPELDRIGFANVYIPLERNEQYIFVAFMWLVWVYLLYRFTLYQRLLADKHLGDVTKTYIERAATKWAWSQIRTEFPENVPQDIPQRDTVAAVRRAGSPRIAISEDFIDVITPVTFANDKGQVLELTGRREQISKRIHPPLCGRIKRIARVNAYRTTPHATEYWLPYLLALLAAIFLIYDLTPIVWTWANRVIPL